MGVRISFKRRVPVAELTDLRKINLQERINGSMLFVLKNMAAFMGD